ncbi:MULTISPECIES: DedA family protein [Hymenobacter]|uniref:DedA family protein n=2 Tax=Hymenobacter TaxID=89966 RepID=A0ABS6X3D4_9BACT|nr:MULTISPECIES: DedA family protein [Hymenobacter]MBO3269886.1 DedA family protein [Hymenobacter defluvii]MBW3130350.1 DedA family protein [Hymenobacter profundi]QNE40760.1 DedA family protein [Hymenobacter sp. NBH84]
MEILHQALDFVLHLDKHLTAIIADYGTWTYAILFLIIFVETGVVVLPFLPGDSLLFAAGSLAALDGSPLNVAVLMVLLIAAAVLGDTLNYHIGDYLGPRVFTDKSRFLKREHLLKTQDFYVKHGAKTLILARFIPIIRTFAPFVAGMGTMSYARFLAYNVIGGILWVILLVGTGYLFGQVPIVQKNFSLVVVAIIVLSILPAVFEFFRSRGQKSAV